MFELEKSKSGSYTLKYNGKYIHSKYDPEKEAVSFCKRNIKLINKEIVIIYGLGLGYHIKELRKIVNEKLIYVLELNNEIINICKKVNNQIFMDKNIKIVGNDERKFIENLIYDNNILIYKPSLEMLKNIDFKFYRLLNSIEFIQEKSTLELINENIQKYFKELCFDCFGDVSFEKHNIEYIIETGEILIPSDSCLTDYFKVVEEVFDIVEKIIERNNEDVEQQIKNILVKLNVNYRIYVLSWMLKYYKKISYANEIFILINNLNTIDIYTKYFLLQQIRQCVFANVIKTDEEYEKNLNICYFGLLEELRNRLPKYKFIEKDKRDNNLIIIFNTQMVSELHAPTGMSLEMAYALNKHFGKEILIINTRESLNLSGFIPIRMVRVANEGYEGGVIKYKDVNFDFYKQKDELINDNTYKTIINMVYEKKPYLIFVIGDGCIAGDLCSKIVPVVVMPTSSGKQLTDSEFFIGNYEDKDKYIIKGGCQLPFVEQKNKYNKEMFNIPQNKFIIAVIGNRLDSELSYDFLEMLNNILEMESFFVIFIGKYDNYTIQTNKFKYIKANSNYIGHQKDLLACFDVIDLFLNPKRKGSGTTAAESLFKGKPVVTLDFGDVAEIAGKDFCVDSYDEMRKILVKYQECSEFYKHQSERARIRGKKYADNDIFIDTYNRIISHEGFN